jgi:hypothetical protein
VAPTFAVLADICGQSRALTEQGLEELSSAGAEQ